MKITSKSSFFKKGVSDEHTIKYGVLRKGANTTVEVLFEDCNHLTHRKSCGCTNPDVTLLNDGFILKINCSNTKVGTINQWVKVKVEMAEKEQKEITILLKGQIV